MPTPAAVPVTSIAILCAALLAATAARPDEPPSDSVGVIDGEAIAVNGPMSVEVIHGQAKTVLRRGAAGGAKSRPAGSVLWEAGRFAFAVRRLLRFSNPVVCGPSPLATDRIHRHMSR